MTTNHSATLSALQSGATFDYMIAVRSFDGSACATTGSLIGTFTTP
jgi:VCBS repeat-containing protein